jgi:hypothetical protein
VGSQFAENSTANHSYAASGLAVKVSLLVERVPPEQLPQASHRFIDVAGMP